MLPYERGFVCTECDPFIDCPTNLEIDHIVPSSRSGGTRLVILQSLCRECHDATGDNLPMNSMSHPLFASDSRVFSSCCVLHSAA